MANEVKSAFERDLLIIPVDRILPLKQVSELIRGTAKYRRIATSIQEVGVIEPLVVARPSLREPHYLLLDGHIRLAILVEQGETQVRCLISGDDEAFTYNKRINRLATVQEHYMITRALARGVSEEKLAKALNVDVGCVKRQRGLLEGICPEVVELLKDRHVGIQSFDVLRKMKPLRQIESVELMIALGNYSTAYAKALLAATRQADLARPDRPKKVGKMTPEQMARMEREMATLNQDFRALEASYGDDVLQLVVTANYVSRLLANPAIEEYLVKRHPDLIGEMKAVAGAASLDQSGAVHVPDVSEEGGVDGDGAVLRWNPDLGRSEWQPTP
jgi:ParB-like chromosome segregation protein Spo0J